MAEGFPIFFKKNVKLFLDQGCQNRAASRHRNQIPLPLTQTMKTAPTKPTRIVAYLRFSAGVAFFAAAAALAFVAATTNVLTANDVAAAKPRLPIAKASIQDSIGGMAIEYSEQDGSFGNPASPAEEEAMKRAYPAD